MATKKQPRSTEGLLRSSPPSPLFLEADRSAMSDDLQDIVAPATRLRKSFKTQNKTGSAGVKFSKPIDMHRVTGGGRPPPVPTGRVEDWRAGLGRSLGSLLSRPFVCECPTISTVPRLQSPPRRTQLTGFPYYAPPFASCQGLWDLSCRSDFRHVSPHPIAVEQPKSVVNPLPTPSLPAEALSFPGMR